MALKLGFADAPFDSVGATGTRTAVIPTSAPNVGAVTTICAPSGHPTLRSFQSKFVGAGASITIPAPAGAVMADELIAVIVVDASNQTDAGAVSIPTPANWNAQTAAHINDASGKIALFVFDTNNAAIQPTYTFNLTLGGPGLAVPIAIILVAYSNINLSANIDDAESQAQVGTSIVSPSGAIIFPPDTGIFWFAALSRAPFSYPGNLNFRGEVSSTLPPPVAPGIPQRATSKLDISIPAQPNPDTGRWGFLRGDDGDVSFDETGTHAVVTSVYSKRNGYWADANHGKRPTGGSITSQTVTLEQANTLEAVRPIEDDGTVSDVSVEVAQPTNAIGALRTDVFWESGQLTLGSVVSAGAGDTGGGG